MRVTDAEITRLSAFKAMSEHDFIQQFTKLHRDRRGLVLQEKPDGSCVFLHGNDCLVQPVKPQQCRDFPNLWNFPGFEKVCHAIPRLVGDVDYRRLLADARGRSPKEVAILSGDGVNDWQAASCQGRQEGQPWTDATCFANCSDSFSDDRLADKGGRRCFIDSNAS